MGRWLYDDPDRDDARFDGADESARLAALDEGNDRVPRCPHCDETRIHSYTRERGWVCPAAPVALPAPIAKGRAA